MRRYVVSTPVGDFTVRAARLGELRSSDETTELVKFFFTSRIRFREPDAIEAAFALLRATTSTSLRLCADQRDGLVLDVLEREIEWALFAGILVAEKAERMVVARQAPPRCIAPSLAPKTAQPAPAEVTRTWFEVTLVDEVGAPLSGVRMTSTGLLGNLVTDDAGTARADGQTGSFARVSFSNDSSVIEELQTRWSEVGRDGSIAEDAKVIETVAPLPSINLESEVPLVVALVPPRCVIHYARHQALPELERGAVLPIWGQLAPMDTDETPLQAMVSALRHVAQTKVRHRVLVAGRGEINDAALLNGVGLLLKGERDAWVQDALARYEVADCHRALIWIAKTKRYQCFPNRVASEWTAPARGALRRFRASFNREFETTLSEDETPRPEEDFSAFYDALASHIRESTDLNADELTEVQSRIRLHNTPQIFGDGDPIAANVPSEGDGIDLLLVREEEASNLPTGDVSEEISNPQRFRFVELKGSQPKRTCKSVDVLDVEDVHFNHDHFILMPMGRLEDEANLEGNRGATGLHVLAAAIRHAEAHPNREMLVVGHADSTGSSDYNLPLSEERAKSVFFVLSGADYKELWVGSSNRDPEERFDDTRRILKWANERFWYDCDPGNTTGPVTAQYYRAVRHFQDRFNSDVQLLRESGNAYGPLYKDEIPSYERGYVGAHTWGAFFDCYQRELIRLANKSLYSELQEVQRGIRLVEPRPVYGCGEYHPRDPERRRVKRAAGYPDGPAERRPEDRRVEILFFDPGEAPPFPCHPTTEVDSCEPRYCWIYDDDWYVHRRLPPHGVGKPVKVELEKVEVRRGEEYVEGNTFCPPLDEDARLSIRVSDVHIPFEGAISAVIIRETTDGPSTVARITHQLCAFKSSDLLVRFRWDGRATVLVPREVSMRTTWDAHTGGLINIPLHEIESGETARQGRYVVQEIVVTEKDGSVAGRSRPNARLLVELLCEACFVRYEFMFGLRDFGFGDGYDWMPVYGPAIVEGIRRTMRKYHSGLGVRFESAVRGGVTRTDALSVAFVRAQVDMGPGPGATRCRITGDGVNLVQNLYAWADRIEGDMWCDVGISSLFVRYRPNTPDGEAFDEAFGPVGVSLPRDPSSGTDFYPPAPKPRAVARDGSVTGNVTNVDEAHTMVSLQEDGQPIVRSTNPAVVPDRRAADIQRAMRAIIWANGTIGAHEFAHYVGLVGTRTYSEELRGTQSITIDGQGTWMAAQDGCEEFHNRNPIGVNLLDPGRTVRCRLLFHLDDVEPTIRIENRQHLLDCLPGEP